MKNKRGRNGPLMGTYPSPLTPEERRKRHLERKRKYAANGGNEKRKARHEARKALRGRYLRSLEV